jgi:hypothetical protein
MLSPLPRLIHRRPPDWTVSSKGGEIQEQTMTLNQEPPVQHQCDSHPQLYHPPARYYHPYPRPPLQETCSMQSGHRTIRINHMLPGEPLPLQHMFPTLSIDNTTWMQWRFRLLDDNTEHYQYAVIHPIINCQCSCPISTLPLPIWTCSFIHNSPKDLQVTPSSPTTNHDHGGNSALWVMSLELKHRSHESHYY